MFIGITDQQQTRLQRVCGAVKDLVDARRGERHERSRGLTGLLDLDSARFDLAVSRAKPLVFPRASRGPLHAARGPTLEGIRAVMSAEQLVGNAGQP